MHVAVSLQEYYDALERLMQIVENVRDDLSTNDRVESAFLAWTWDSTLVSQCCRDRTGAEMLDALAMSDSETRELILTLIAGRLNFGRPINHPNSEQILRFHRRYTTGTFK